MRRYVRHLAGPMANRATRFVVARFALTYMKFILAKKEGMTRIFGEDGHARAATLLKTDGVTVTQVKEKSGEDGYNAVQVGFGTRKTKNISKAVLGHTKDKGYAVIREFRLPNEAEDTQNGITEVGSVLDASIFEVGDTVTVAGVTKGKGFAGVVKRHGFHGGPRSHGQKHSEREAGSIGGSGGRAGGRVAKGMRMAGRMGGDRVTVKNLTILAIDVKTGEILVSGAVPGNRGAVLEIVGTSVSSNQGT